MIYFYYFLAGFILDILATLDIRYVQQDKALRSANVSFIGGAIYYFYLFDIILSPDRKMLVFAYLFGGWIGTIVVMRYKRILEKYLIFNKYKITFRSKNEDQYFG